MRLPLATSTWSEAEIEAMQSVIQSGNFTMGQHVLEFEKDFAEYVGSEYAVMVNSGSSANLIAVAALFYRSHDALKPGDEVIVPAVSWPTTYYPLHQYGLKLKFVDIDINTLNYDLNALGGAITDKTRAIMVVNLLGNPNDFDYIRKLIGERNILLLEDNCESLGAEFNGKQAGTFGVMGTYSSFFSHHISTMEGGVVVTDDEELYHILLTLRAHGWTRNLPKENHITGTKSDDWFSESFKFVLPGYNLRPLELNGAVGKVQLKKLRTFLDARMTNGQYFREIFSNLANIRIQKEIGKSSWFGFSLVVDKDAPFSRTHLLSLLETNGFECRPIVAGNFTKNKVLEWFNYEIHGEVKNAEYIDQNGLFIGNHHYDITESLRVLRDKISDMSRSGKNVNM